MCIRRETWEKARRSLAFPPVSKPHTHITNMLWQCTSIVYVDSDSVWYFIIDSGSIWYFIVDSDSVWYFIVDSGSKCRKGFFNPTCYEHNTKGKIAMSSATWKQGCSWNYSPVQHNVLSTLQNSCNNRYVLKIKR